MTTLDVSHVLHLSENGRNNPISGAERHVITLLEGLAARGTRAELTALIWNDGPIVRRELGALEAAGVRVTRIHKRRATTLIGRVLTALSAWMRLWAHLRHRRGAIVHLHLELVAPVVAAALARCPRVIVTIHNDEPHYMAWRWRIWLSFVNTVVRRYIAISGRVATYFAEAAGAPPASIATVLYGLHEPAQIGEARARFGVADDRFVIGFVGRLVPQKDPELLIRAVADWPECTLVIVGTGPLEERLRALVAELGLSNVRLTGAIPDAARLVTAFDVLCVPSRWEGFGLNVLEAMLAGVPVVASATGALPELLDAGRCGVLVPPASRDELSRALRGLASDPSRRRELAARARLRATSVYTVSRMVDETMSVYAGARLAG